MGIPSQFIMTETVLKGEQMRGMLTSFFRQLSAKSKVDLYRLNLQNLSKTMVVGVDITKQLSKSILGLSATYTENLTQHFSQVKSHENAKREKGIDR